MKNEFVIRDNRYLGSALSDSSFTAALRRSDHFFFLFSLFSPRYTPRLKLNRFSMDRDRVSDRERILVSLKLRFGL